MAKPDSGAPRPVGIEVNRRSGPLYALGLFAALRLSTLDFLVIGPTLSTITDSGSAPGVGG
jgi:hypothetical protein